MDPAHFEADAEGKSKVTGEPANGSLKEFSRTTTLMMMLRKQNSVCPVNVIKVNILNE